MHANPDVNDDKEHRRGVRRGAEPPERHGACGKGEKAAHLQITQIGSLPRPNIDAGDDPDDDGDGDIDVGQVDGPEPVQKQRVAGRLAGDRARHDQEQIGEERHRAGQFAASQPEHTFRKREHQEKQPGVLISSP